MGDERNHQGSSRRWLVTELDNSLRRLGVDHIDLYQIHRWDPSASDEETLSALTDLQRAGKIRCFGSATFPAYRYPRHPRQRESGWTQGPVRGCRRGAVAHFRRGGASRPGESGQSTCLGRGGRRRCARSSGGGLV